MLCGVITETFHAEAQKVVYISHIIVLEVRILSVNVGQSTHFASGALISVIVILDRSKSVGMIELVVATYCIVEVRQHCGMVDSGMVGEHVYYNLHAIFVCTVHHGFELITVAKKIVAYLPVNGLVIVIPFTSDGITLL